MKTRIKYKEPLIDTNEARKILGMKWRGWIYVAIKKHGLPHYKITSQSIRFKRSEIYEWIEKRKLVLTMGGM